MTPLLALLLAATPPPVGAWVPLEAPRESGSGAYDSGSVERRGDKVNVWVRWIAEPEGAFQETRVMFEIDCRARTGRTVLVASYGRDGALTGGTDGSTAEAPIRTGSTGHGIELALCPRS